MMVDIAGTDRRNIYIRVVLGGVHPNLDFGPCVVRPFGSGVGVTLEVRLHVCLSKKIVMEEVSVRRG
jgi:hypothetical protein